MSGLVVIGASYAGIQAVLSARDAGYCETISVISDETWLPYQRPPLSKEFLLGRQNEAALTLRNSAFFTSRKIDLLLGVRTTEIDRDAQRVLLSDGATLTFDKLLIATGSCARRLSAPGANLDGVCYLRSMDDAIELRSRLQEAAEIVIVGGGFIGLEVAASASQLGKRVTLIESGPRLLMRAVSPIVSEFLLAMHRKHGVDVRLGENLVSIEGRNGKVVSVNCGQTCRIGADLVVVGIGGLANSQIAEAAQLLCRDGIVVDDCAQTSDPRIYAAGDCTIHDNVFAEGWLRLESVQHAQDQGKAAGLAIAGRSSPYVSVPRFWSDQYASKLQIAGISAGFDAHAVRGSIEEGKFSLFYYKGGRLVAVDSLDRAGDQMAARKLLAGRLTPSPEQVADPSFDFRSMMGLASEANAS